MTEAKIMYAINVCLVLVNVAGLVSSNGQNQLAWLGFFISGGMAGLYFKELVRAA